MTREVDAKLHSEAPVVMIEAAGGCGKTTKAAKYAGEAAERLTSGKVLLLSHTHAACGEFQRKCAALGRKIDVETCDSFFLKAIGAYAQPLGLPSPIESHLGRPADGIPFSALSEKAVELFRRAPTVARAVAAHYPVIVLDEHQDASVHQHEAVRLLREIGNAHLRIFGDPMQAIHPGNDNGYVDWDALWAAADGRGLLEEPHRWAGAPELGEWIMASRAALKAGNPVVLRDAPACVWTVSHNALAGRERFRDMPTASREVHAFLNGAPDSAAVLAFLGNMAKSSAQAGGWRAPLNEGAQLDELEVLIQGLEAQAGNAQGLAGAFLDFLAVIGVGLTADLSDGLRGRLGAAINRDRAGRNQIAWLGCLEPIYASPDHRGVAVATGKPDVRGAYGLHGRELVAWLTHLQHTRAKNVWFVGILAEKLDDFNRRVFQPQIDGSKTGLELPGIVDEVLTMAEIKDESGTPYRAFVCQTINSWNFPAKDRSGRLDLIEEPHLGRLMAKKAIDWRGLYKNPGA